MLDVVNLCVSYGPIQALSDVSIQVGEAEILAILGSNGVGKTTLLRSIAGILPAASGEVYFKGASIGRSRSAARVKNGIILVPEGRRLFNELSVEENLRLGAYPWYKRALHAEFEREMEEIYQLFPVLRDRRAQAAGTLSGGQQQMVAIGRGLMSRPALLLLDEPSLGLAPLIIKEIFTALSGLRRARGVSIVIVEQDTQAAMSIADRGYVMQRAKIVLSGSAKQLMEDPATREIYFGKQA